MCTTATAKRRRRQARMNNAHLAKIGRREYHKMSAEKSASREARKAATRHRMAQKKKKG